MEHYRDCDTTWEVCGNIKSAQFPLNVHNNLQENSSQGNQYNGIPQLIKKITQISEFSLVFPEQFAVVTPEQSKHIKPVELAILSMIPQGNPELIAYLNELLRTSKTEQQNNTCWFPTPQNPGKAQHRIPVQIRNLKEIIEVEEKEKFNPQEGTKGRNKLLKDFIELTDF